MNVGVNSNALLSFCSKMQSQTELQEIGNWCYLDLYIYFISSQSFGKDVLGLKSIDSCLDNFSIYWTSFLIFEFGDIVTYQSISTKTLCMVVLWINYFVWYIHLTKFCCNAISNCKVVIKFYHLLLVHTINERSMWKGWEWEI